MTVVEQLFEEIRTWTSINDALRMQLEADIQIWLQKEQEQLNKAWQDGAVTAQNDAAKEIEKNYVACNNDRNKCQCKDWGGCTVDYSF